MMGEAHKLTADESLAVVNRVIGRAQGRQVIVGVSHAGLENVRRLAHEAMIAGASGVMVAPPPGLKGDDGVYNYYAQVFTGARPRHSASSTRTIRRPPASISRRRCSSAWSTTSSSSSC